MATNPQILDFASLDQVALGIERETLDRADIPFFEAGPLGPMAEAWVISKTWKGTAFEDVSWLEAGCFSNMFEELGSGVTRSQLTGVLTSWLGSDQILDRVSWTGFLMRVSSAIKSCGFDDHAKNGISAALREFRSNIAEHAGQVDGSFVAFHASELTFEVVVADRGRGVLQSLQENPNYSDLIDAGRALQLTVSDGVSRHSDPLRGRGFNDLFKGLANRFSHIRLRSGDHALEVVRKGGAAPDQRVSQKAQIPGLSVYARFDK